MYSILILYSSPAGEQRLRLDREHKRIESAITHAGGNSSDVRRYHAVTLDDLARAIAADKFELIHFSGHGSPDGFCFESDGSDDGELISPEHLNRIISVSQPTISALILISCYSSDTALELLKSSPYVVSISGPADDDAAITFVGHFYEEYFRSKSIERAFKFSSAVVDNRLTTVLMHRSKSKKSSATKPTATVVVYPGGIHVQSDPIYVDYTEARDSISKLDVPIDRFLSILIRKIRIHHWIFKGERESVILPIADYFAAFSWRNAKDVVTCHWVRKPRSGLQFETLDILASLIVSYNDLYVSPYRTSSKRVENQDPRNLEDAISKMHRVHKHFLMDERNYSRLESILPDQIRMLRANCWANLQKADEKLAARQLSSAAIYAETVLSTIHDAIDALVDAISSAAVG